MIPIVLIRYLFPMFLSVIRPFQEQRTYRDPLCYPPEEIYLVKMDRKTSIIMNQFSLRICFITKILALLHKKTRQ